MNPKEPMKIVLGIDPGMNGAIAALNEKGGMIVYKMPETDVDILTTMRECMEMGRCHAFLEQVHSMPGQGVSSSFKFGEGYGKLQMALAALHIPYERVTPQKWQKAMGCMTKGDKNVSRRRAQELYPFIKCTHAISDAMLIARYGMMQSVQGQRAGVDREGTSTKD